MKLFKGIANMFSSKEEQDQGKNPGRNELCWCGSGKKYKKCHLPVDEKKAGRNGAPACGKT